MPLKRIHFFISPFKNRLQLSLNNFCAPVLGGKACCACVHFGTHVFWIHTKPFSYLWTPRRTCNVLCAWDTYMYPKCVEKIRFNQRIHKLIYVLVSFYLRLTRRFNRIDSFFLKKINYTLWLYLYFIPYTCITALWFVFWIVLFFFVSSFLLELVDCVCLKVVHWNENTIILLKFKR